MIIYDPEEYKETSMELSIQHVHDGTTKLKCWSYSITRLIESKRVKHCLNKPPTELRCLLGRRFRLIPLRSSGCSQDLES